MLQRGIKASLIASLIALAYFVTVPALAVPQPTVTIPTLSAGPSVTPDQCRTLIERRVMVACNTKQKANWQVERTADKLCGGTDASFGLGNDVVYSVIGSPKNCPDNSAPAQSGWNCMFKVSLDYIVTVTHVLQSTCT